MSKISLLQLSLCTLGSFYVSSNSTLAQVTSDGTIGTQVNQNANSAEITGGQTRGGNLFHSFQSFSVPVNNEAFFQNANDISNIFSRVTGGNISNIDGLIRANGSSNLFLINPAGIIFGESARLDIGGSFYGSSASSILFEDGEFSAADLENPPLLTVNAPIGLGFRDAPGNIINRASIVSVSEGENISLVGGNVSVEDGGTIGAIGGRVGLGGLVEAGTIDITEDNSLSFPDGVARGDVSFSNESGVFVLGEEGGAISINAKNFSLVSGRGLFLNIDGSVESQAGDIVLNIQEDILIDGGTSNGDTTINNSNFGSGTPGNIEVTARNITIRNGGNILSANTSIGDTGTITITALNNISIDGVKTFPDGIVIPSGIRNFIQGTGDAEKVTINAQNLSITNGANIFSLVSGTGNGGNLNINVSETINVDGASNIRSLIGDAGIGRAGDININASNISLTNRGTIDSTLNGKGSTGNITINANDILIENLSDISNTVLGNFENTDFTEGNGGNITITTDDLSLIDGGAIDASNFNAIGSAGNISIAASEKISVDGNDNELSFFSNISASVFGSTGNSGNIDIETPQLTVTNGAFISASNVGDTEGTLGSIEINTNKLSVLNAGQISVSTSGNGSAGNLTINSTKSIELSGFTNEFRGGLFASAVEENGTGGDINVVTNELKIDDGAAIAASNFPTLETSESIPGSGQPGNINIEANSISLNTGGRIEAVTQSEIGEGANIDLQVAGDITLKNNSFISAKAINQGDGGNLTIDSRFIIAFPNGNNDILASAEQGEGGNITIDAESLLGIQERAETPETNDINASSDFDLDGSININTSDINPVQGATELPSNVVEPEETTQQACEANREAAAKNGLNIEGKGGIPAEPGLPLNSLNVSINGEINATSSIPAPIETSQGKIQPARGIKVTESGEVILTAYRTEESDKPGGIAPQRIPNNSRNCR